MAEKAKIKKSQTPVALVYFATMLLFLAVFGLVASFLINRIDELNQPDAPEPTPVTPTFNTLYARVNSKNVLADMSIVRISPENNSVTVIPLSSFIKADNDLTFREIYNDGGMKELKNSVESSLSLTVDNYLTISNDAFDTIVDLLGGVIYTPSEELYYLSDNDADDISLRKGKTVTLVGRQVRLLFQYPVFSEGKSGNQEFMGTAMNSIIRSVFKQTSITTNNLDNMYGIITENSTTDLDKTIYKTQKSYIKQMLSTNAVNCKMLLPSGVWTDEKMELSEDFKNQLAQLIQQTEPSTAAE